MKSIQLLKQTMLVGLLFIMAQSARGSTPGTKTDQPDTTGYITYTGIVKTENSRDVLPFATIEVEGSGVATVTNIDGEFTIKVRKDTGNKNLKISYLGYVNKSIPISESGKNEELIIELQTVPQQIRELTIRPMNGLEIMKKVLNKIRDNYSRDPMMMTGFYRETVKNRRNYVSISEAVVDIYKAGYTSNAQYDQVRIDKGRKSADVEKMDTVIVKLQGGPATSLLLDIVKNPYELLTEDYDKIYDFSLDNIISFNDRLHYVIDFKQKPYIDEPFFYGKFYVDMDNLAISEATFSLNLENEEEASRFFLRKKPFGMKFIPEDVVYRSSFTIQDDQWFFNYARAELNFKINWNKKLFNSKYSIMSELAVTDRRIKGAEKIKFRERFNKSDILDEEVYVFFDPDYWGAYNVIEPDQSNEAAIEKLNRKYNK